MKRLLECVVVMAAFGGCAIDDGTDSPADEVSETESAISVQKVNVTTLGGAGLCLWVAGRCTHMPQCTTFWVDSVNWSSGMAYGYSYYLGRWGQANKDYLTAGRFWVDSTHWCQPG